MNNIAAASVLLPAVFGAAQKSKISSSRLLMPLAFSTLLGGMATLFTTTNIVVNSLLRDYGLPGFRVYDFLPLGMPIILVGTIYMVWIGRKWLPAQSPIQRLQAIQPSGEELAEIYRLDERLALARVIDHSPLIGVPLNRSRLREQYHLNLIAIQKTGHVLVLPTPDMIFARHDMLLIAGRPEDFEQPGLQSIIQVLPSLPTHEQITEARDVALFEAILSPRSTLIGQTLKAALFREKYMMNVIAIWRAGKPIRTRLTDLPLQFGDSLLMQGPRDRLKVLRSNPDLIVLTGKDIEEISRPSKAWLAVSIMLVTLALAALSGVMIGEVILAGRNRHGFAGYLEYGPGVPGYRMAERLPGGRHAPVRYCHEQDRRSRIAGAEYLQHARSGRAVCIAGRAFYPGGGIDPGDQRTGGGGDRRPYRHRHRPKERI